MSEVYSVKTNVQLVAADQHQSNHSLLEVPCTSLYQLVQGKKGWQEKGMQAHSFLRQEHAHIELWSY